MIHMFCTVQPLSCALLPLQLHFSCTASVPQELHDPLAVMLMIRINRENTLAMNRRRCPALDGHFDRVNLALWPRLKVGVAIWAVIAAGSPAQCT